MMGPDGIIYPGTCRGRLEHRFPAVPRRPADTPLRLDIGRAVTCVAGLFQHQTASFTETGQSPDGASGDIFFTAPELTQTVGDVVLSRRDMGTSYHLSVVLDDAAQGVTQVVRGQDLFEATRIHVLLQALLDLPQPIYHHHRLIRDENGKRLAKRDDARAISKFRDEGATPDDIRRMVGL